MGLASRRDRASVRRRNGSQGTAVMPMPAYVEGTDAPYASTARSGLLFSTHHFVPHSSIGPPFIHRKNSVRERGWGFVRGRPRLNGHTLLWASGRRRYRLSLYRVPLG